jgi:nucleoside 2-deoxyribosyltransferase
MKKIYLAGPDVFLKDAKEYGEELKNLCKKYGFEGLFPLDNEITASTPSQMAKEIKKANIELIKKCDYVLANLSSFRGCEPDSGTVWEVGYAQGLGKKVVAYSDDLRDLKIKTIEKLELKKDSDVDNKEMLIEDFGLSHNLMFADTVVTDSFLGALEYLKKFVTKL